jgi:dTDP-D-glucose 4,6-dehydratase
MYREKIVELTAWKNSPVRKPLGRAERTSEQLITCVTDRAGHDLRYAIDSNKLKNELLGTLPAI